MTEVVQRGLKAGVSLAETPRPTPTIRRVIDEADLLRRPLRVQSDSGAAFAPRNGNLVIEVLLDPGDLEYATLLIAAGLSKVFLSVWLLFVFAREMWLPRTHAG